MTTRSGTAPTGVSRLAIATFTRTCTFPPPPSASKLPSGSCRAVALGDLTLFLFCSLARAFSFHLSATEVVEFCKDCVLGDGEEPCDIPDAFYDEIDNGKLLP